MFYRSNEINKLLEETDISHVIYGDKAKEEYVIKKCPFCGKQSLLIDSLRKTYVCLECKSGGNIFSYLLNFMDVEKAINSIENIQKMEELQLDNSEEIELKNIVMHMMHFYEDHVNEPICKKYLKKRNITEEITKMYHLGYSGKFGSELFDYLLSKGLNKESLINSKLFGETNEKGKTIYYDKFYDRLIFPIFNRNFEVIGFGGRTLKNSNAKYLNSAENIIFRKGENLYGYQLALKTKKSYLILCEGNIDMIMAQQNGFLNTAASLGTALTNEQCEMISKDFKHVLLAYDNDDAGRKATMKAIRLLNKYNIKPNVLDLSPCKDPDEFFNTIGKEEFLKRVNHSISGSLFMKKYIASLPVEERIPIIEQMLEKGDNYEEL